MQRDDDESVRIAVRALGDMRSGGGSSSSPAASFQPTPALSMASGSSSPSLSSPSLAGEDAALMRRPEDEDFVSRVSKLPILNTALQAYEQSKASSRMVKYGAEMMESSVKSISRPVIERLPVNQLDEFARKQLDRIESYTRRTPSQDRGRSANDYEQTRDAQWQSRDVSMTRDTNDRDGWRSGPSSSYDAQSRPDTPRSTQFPSTLPRPPQLTGSTSQYSQQDDRPSSSSGQPENQQVVQRSRWHTVLLEAGGISMAVSDESMRRLKYCLQWLQFATAQIDAQILVLRNFISSLEPDAISGSCRAISPQHLRTLNDAKRDVVETLRQVVDVISKYAGGALPEPARARVRSFILHLPRRWAQAAGVDGPGPSPLSSVTSSVAGSSSGAETHTHGGADRRDHRSGVASAPYTYGPGEAGPSQRSRPASRATSPSRSKAHSRQSSGRNAHDTPTTPDAASKAASRILTLATESLDMLRGVTTVCKDSLDRADAWVERLRVVGLQRQQNPDGPPSQDDPMPDMRSAQLPPISTFTYPHSFSHTSYSPTAPRSPLSPYVSMSPTSSGRSTPLYGGSDMHLRRSSSTSSGFATASASYYSLDGPSSSAFEGLTLSGSVPGSSVNSRYATPRSVVTALPEDVPLSGTARGEKRGAGEVEEDAAVAAAAALAGLAGAKRARQDAGREDSSLYMRRGTAGRNGYGMNVDG